MSNNDAERRFRWDNGWRGPFVCAEFAARGMDAGCGGELHIQQASREFRCVRHCAGPEHCNEPDAHAEEA